MNPWPHPTPRTAAQLVEWANNIVPCEPLLAITQAEARQYMHWRTYDPKQSAEMRLMGRPAIIIDLPPGQALWRGEA